MVCFATMKSGWSLRGGALAIAVATLCVAGTVTAQVRGDAAGNAGARQYPVRSGDTLDRIISQQIGSSPFSIVFLRDALARMNPQALPQGARGTLLAGAVMQIPDSCELRQMAFGDAGVCGEARGGATGNGRAAPLNAAERAELERRSWVRYP